MGRLHVEGGPSEELIEGSIISPDVLRSVVGSL